METKILSSSLNPPALGSPVIFGSTPYLVNKILYALGWEPEISFLNKLLGNPIIKTQLWNYIFRKDFLNPSQACELPQHLTSSCVYHIDLSPQLCWVQEGSSFVICSSEFRTVLMSSTKILTHSKDRRPDARVETPIQSMQGESLSSLLWDQWQPIHISIFPSPCCLIMISLIVGLPH